MSPRFPQAVVRLCLVLAIAGCGGGREEAAPPPRLPTAGADWSYVALGDSLAAGVAAQEGYVARYAAHIRADTRAIVRVTNLGVPGWTSADLLRTLRSDQAVRSAIADAHVVSWDIGGNDLLRSWNAFREGRCGGDDGLDCFRQVVPQFKENWDAILTEVLALRNRDATILRTMDVYNPFVALQKATGTFERLRPYLDEVNAHIQLTAARSGVPVARVHGAFNGTRGDDDAGAKGYIASDLLHPNDAGHGVIAAELRRLGYAPLR